MTFRPEEVLFAPTVRCNLRCPHCSVKPSRATVSRAAARRFLRQCKTLGIGRVGFTGGEPFLVPGLLADLIRRARGEGMAFDRIMTNGVWAPDAAAARRALRRIYRAGFDGTICISVDAFHRQKTAVLAGFIRSAVALWHRGDIISIAYVAGVRDRTTAAKFSRLARRLRAKLSRYARGLWSMRGDGFFIPIFPIALSPIGTASALKDPWDGRPFTDDRCAGPGNVFFVEPGGDVKPCCGYASDHPALTIGNIRRDSAARILANARKNRFVATVFRRGLGTIRARAIRRGVTFPGKTGDPCFFCHYLLTEVPRDILEQCLDR